nr:uncharacterized protein LOC129258441 [Lytechinus pictus]
MTDISNACGSVFEAELKLASKELQEGWQVGFSSRENKAYYFNTSTGVTQWESPSPAIEEESDKDSNTVTRLSQHPPSMEQRPILPSMPAGLHPPPTPVAAHHTKDIFRFPEGTPTPVSTPDKRKASTSVEIAEKDHAAAKKARKQLKLEIPASISEAPRKKVDDDGKVEGFPEDVHAIPLGGKRFAVVKTFNKEIYVNVREYYNIGHHGTRMMAGRKGINLTRENWLNLAAAVPGIHKAIDRKRFQLLQNNKS